MESLVAYMPDQPRSQGLLLLGTLGMKLHANAFFSCLRTTTVRAIFHSLFCNALQVVNKNTPPFEIEAACQVLKQILGLQTSNNQKLRSAGDNDRRSKRFAPALCFA